jgi:diguanylate cyclase (GGDEF)-like protein
MGEDLFASLIAGMGEGVVVVDVAETVVFCSEAASRLLGLRSGGGADAIARIESLELRATGAHGFAGPGQAIRDALAGHAIEIGTAIVPAGGDAEERFVALAARPLPDGPGKRRAVVGIRDVTHEVRLEDRLRQNEGRATDPASAPSPHDIAETQAAAARLTALVDHLSTAVLFEDASNRVVLVNRAYCKMFGVGEPSALVGGPVHVPPVLDASTFFRLRDARKTARVPALSDRVELLDGRVLERDYVPVDVASVVEGHFWCYRDVTERERAREHLAELSNRDELTTLYNRRGFVTLAEQWLRLAARTKRTPLLLFVDVNGMKPVNDRLGHAVGDRMLRDTADLLRATFRDSDIVARLGGDEFVVLAVDALPTHATLLSDRLQRNVERFNQHVQRPYVVSMSVGVSVWDPAQPRDIAALLAEADAHMYEAKRRRPQNEVLRAASGA